jgi:fluoroquinolone transport system ATP-binding protein
MISVHNLNYTYPSADRPAVHDVSFEVQPGEIFGFLGPSGAGKSTTQKILIKLLKGFEGHASVLGKELGAWGNDYYEHIGVSFELPNHYQKLTGLENLRLFGALYQRQKHDPMELLDRVGLKDDANTLVSAYSKGMQMRLNLVRALLHGPELLFLDEPTAGLDPVNGRRIKEMALELKRDGHTIFLTTHDMYVADELCDRVAFMVDGTLTRIASPRALKLEHGERTVRVEYHQDDGTAQEVFPLAGLGTNDAFGELLRTREVETIHTQEATLEDIFIRVTGRELTSEG